MQRAPVVLSSRRSFLHCWPRPRQVLLAGIVLGTVLALLTTGASAAPTPFSLTFEGAHVNDPTLPAGVRHDGRFTASAPFCSSGRAYDTRQIKTVRP